MKRVVFKFVNVKVEQFDDGSVLIEKGKDSVSLSKNEAKILGLLDFYQEWLKNIG